MRTIVAIICVALLMWGESASAQSPYVLKVSKHRDVDLTTQELKKLLARATQLLKTKDGANDVVCNVTFKLDGEIKPFASDRTPAVIRTEEDRDAVHAEAGDIKFVKAIKSCRNGVSFEGCAWPPQMERKSRSVIIAYPGSDPDLRHIVFAHEFGHRMGLRHRNERHALMTDCGLTSKNVQVTADECRCFRSGPGSCEDRPDPPTDIMKCLMSGKRSSPASSASAGGPDQPRHLADWFKSR